MGDEQTVLGCGIAGQELRSLLLNDQEIMAALGVNMRILTRLRYLRGLPHINLTKGVRRYRKEDVYTWLGERVIVLNPSELFGEGFVPEEDDEHELDMIKENIVGKKQVVESKGMKVKTKVKKLKKGR